MIVFDIEALGYNAALVIRAEFWPIELISRTTERLYQVNLTEVPKHPPPHHIAIREFPLLSALGEAATA